MIREIKCPECSSIIKTERVCEVCGEVLRDLIIRRVGSGIVSLDGIPVETKIGRQDYDFCSVKCLFEFIDSEIKKEKA